MENATSFPGFEYPATELRKYLRSADHFTIMLKNGDIVHHEPDHPISFSAWLKRNCIENIKQEYGET